MRTLEEIVDLARSGDKPEYDELRYAVCAMQQLLLLDSYALLRLAQREGSGADNATLANLEFNEWYRRMKNANTQSPKEYVGWNNDPDNPAFQERRQENTAMYNAIAGAASND